jgi:sporulation protein YpjB
LEKNRKFIWFFILMGLLLAWPVHTLVTKLDQPAEQQHLAELDNMAEELLQLTRKGDVEGAQQKIVQLAERFPQQSLSRSLRIESLNAVTQSILAAKKMFAAAEVSDEQLLWHATRVRVAIDALSHVHQPMWRSYSHSYMNQLQNLMQSAVERDYRQFQTQFEENYSQYMAIKPAMSIQLEEEQMNQIADSYERIAREMRQSTIEWQAIREALRELSTHMQSAFLGEDKSTAALLIGPGSPFMLIAAIASVLIVTLSYVGWKKYAAEQARTT